MSSYCVYRYWSPNNKSYIGQTNQGIAVRAGKNGYGYRVCPHFYAAIKKYGWDWFENHREILADNLSHEEADKLEQYYIQEYDSIKNGYNVQIGGTFNTRDMFIKGVVGINCFTKDIVHFDSITEAKRALNIKSTKISTIAEHKGNFKTVGDYTWIYRNEWDTLSCEERQKYFDITPALHAKGWSKYFRIVRLNDGKRYSTMREAAQDNGTYSWNIGKFLKGELRSAGKMPDGAPIRWSREKVTA